jgi:hypothetical protein
MTSLQNFMKIYQFKSYWGDTDKQTGDLISLTFLFKESRLKSRFLNTELSGPICHSGTTFGSVGQISKVVGISTV